MAIRKVETVVDVVDKETGEVKEVTGQQFIDLLRQQEKGDLMADAEARLLEVVEAVQRTGKPGVLTVKLKIQQPQQPLDGAAVFILAAVTATVPVPDRKTSLFYAVDGQISRRDPRQAELPSINAVGKPADMDAAVGGGTGKAI